MAYTVIHNGIVFIEGSHPNAVHGSLVECDLSFKFGAQLKSLRDVKDNLSEQAKNQGYNCILDFIYGQKSRWLAIDDVGFWGKGKLAKLTDEDFCEITKAKNEK